MERVRAREGRRVPGWVVEHLGCKVRLSKPWRDDALKIEYPAGAVGTLVSIQSGRRSAYATVELDDCPVGGEENFQFGELRPL